MNFKKLFFTSPVLIISFSIFPSQSWADSGTATGRPDPAATTVQVPRAEYRSPFAAYRTFQEQEIGDWRRSNDTVGSIGGWRAYARESAPATTGGGASSGSSGSGSGERAADPHAGHAQAPQSQSTPGGGAKSPSPAKPSAQQHDMKEKMQGMSPEMQQKMKEKMQGMSPEMQQKMKEKMQGMSPEMQQKMQGKPGAAKDDPAMRGAVPQAPKNPNDAHQHH